MKLRILAGLVLAMSAFGYSTQYNIENEVRHMGNGEGNAYVRIYDSYVHSVRVRWHDNVQGGDNSVGTICVYDSYYGQNYCSESGYKNIDGNMEEKEFYFNRPVRADYVKFQIRKNNHLSEGSNAYIKWIQVND